MGEPVSLLGNARAFARDHARDQMPPGYLWDVVDYVPAIIDTNLTGRGKWGWGSQVTGSGDVEVGILATFVGGDQLLVQTAGGRVARVNFDGAGGNQALNSVSDLGAAPHGIQNPVQYEESVVHFDGAKTRQPQLWRAGGVVDANAAHKFAPVGTVWQGSLVSGGAPGEEHVIRYSAAGEDLTTAASFDVNAFDATSTRVTALKGMRSVCLVFHPSSVERLRGGPLPSTAAGEEGGLILETLFDRVGCVHPKTIDTWNENCIFADEHGVHITDGATLRNLTTAGGISYFWRLLYEGASTICGTVFLDYYIITIRHPSSSPPPFLMDQMTETRDAPMVPELPEIGPPLPDPANYNTTLICDLNRRQWFRWSNCNMLTYISAGGTLGMERTWGSAAGQGRLARMGPCFYPDHDVAQVDDNGWVIKPRFETPWYRLRDEGRKRVRFLYLSYDARTNAPVVDPLRVGFQYSPELTSYTQAGLLPATNGYTRYRLPVNRNPYGIGFYVEAVQPTTALRIYGLGTEAQPVERSRV